MVQGQIKTSSGSFHRSSENIDCLCITAGLLLLKCRMVNLRFKKVLLTSLEMVESCSYSPDSSVISLDIYLYNLYMLMY